MKIKNNPKPSIFLIVLLTLSLLIGVTALVLHIFSESPTIVYVDAQKLVSGYKGMQDARKEFEAKSKAWQSNLDTLRTELELKIKEYESSSVKLSNREKTLMEELIQSKQEQYLNYQEVVAEKIRQEDQELTTKVLAKVNDYVKRYGEDKGYAIILAATQFGNIVYAEESRDITEEVLTGLNVEYGN